MAIYGNITNIQAGEMTFITCEGSQDGRQIFKHFFCWTAQERLSLSNERVIPRFSGYTNRCRQTKIHTYRQVRWWLSPVKVAKMDDKCSNISSVEQHKNVCPFRTKAWCHVSQDTPIVADRQRYTYTDRWDDGYHLWR